MIKKENNKKKLQAFTSCRLLIIVQEKWLKTITIQFPNSILIFLYTSLCYMLYVYVICVFGRSWRYDSSCFAFYFISLSLFDFSGYLKLSSLSSGLCLGCWICTLPMWRLVMSLPSLWGPPCSALIMSSHWWCCWTCSSPWWTTLTNSLL